MLDPERRHVLLFSMHICVGVSLTDLSVKVFYIEQIVCPGGTYRFCEYIKWL